MPTLNTQTFIKAEKGPADSDIYTNSDGKRFIARGGHRNYRNNNPGNLVSGTVSKRNGQIGVVARFAVFPTEEAGWNALRDCLKNTYGNYTIIEMVPKYAPSHENDTDAYVATLLKNTGISKNKRINQLTKDEFEALVKTIARVEGKLRPTLTELPPGKKRITRVMKDEKGVIVQYDVETFGWLSKPEAIAYTKSNLIEAVVAVSTAGNEYLRTRPDITVVNNFSNKGQS